MTKGSCGASLLERGEQASFGHRVRPCSAWGWSSAGKQTGDVTCRGLVHEPAMLGEGATAVVGA